MTFKLKHVFVDAIPQSEICAIVVAEREFFCSLTPYVDKGWINRKRKKDALESECCAILEGIKSTSGRTTVYSDRKDVVDILNNNIEGRKIEKELEHCLTDIRKLCAKRQILFMYIPRESNPATSLSPTERARL